MIIKIIIGIFLYLLCGVGVLEIFKWHDRQVNWIDKWASSESMQVAIVLFMPLSLIWAMGYLLYLSILKFIKITRVLFTTLVFLIIAIFKRNDDGGFR